jgi:hypothetical protein
MNAATRSQCRSCEAPIYWVLTAAKKRMPVDAEPTSDGNVLLSLRGDELVAEVIGPNREVPVGRKRYRAHWATCSHAAEHRLKPGEKPRSPCGCGAVSRWCRKCGACQAEGHAMCGCGGTP